MDDGHIQVESTETGTNQEDEKVKAFPVQQGDEDNVKNSPEREVEVSLDDDIAMEFKKQVKPSSMKRRKIVKKKRG